MPQTSAEIKVSFNTLAHSVIERSARGTLVVIMTDTTQTKEKVTITSVGDIIKTDWEVKNYELLLKLFTTGEKSPNKILIYIQGTKKATELVAELTDVKFNYLVAPTADASDDTAYVAFAKSTWEKKGLTYFSHLATGSDDVSIVEVPNAKLTFERDYTDGEVTAIVAAIITGMPINRSGDMFIIKGALDCDTQAGVDGKLTIYNDSEHVRIRLAVNSKTQFDTTWKSSTRKIKIVDSMNIIRMDISQTFKNKWVGKYPTDYQNKMAFCNIVNQSYFKSLQPNILSEDYNNHITIDLKEQKKFIVADGKDPHSMKELEIKRYPTADNVYLTGDVRITDTMTNLYLVISM